jgi:hypothetical protein
MYKNQLDHDFVSSALIEPMKPDKQHSPKSNRTNHATTIMQQQSHNTIAQPHNHATTQSYNHTTTQPHNHMKDRVPDLVFV